MYLSIILGPASGLISGIEAIIEPETQYIYLPITSCFIGFIAGIIIAITKFGSFEERISEHKRSASKYISIKNNINRQLALTASERIAPKEYLEWLGNSVDELFSVSPLLPKVAYREETQHIEISNPSLQVKSRPVDHSYHYSDERMIYELGRLNNV